MYEKDPMSNKGSDDSERVYTIARIIFLRLAAQTSPQDVNEAAWEHGLVGYKRNPELFPFIGACVSAADEIAKHLNGQ